MADRGQHLPETDNGSSATPIVVLNRDLMFGVQIANVVRALGFTPRFARTTEEFVAEMGDGEPRPALGILDMNGPIEWTLIASLVGREASPPVLGFGPHVDVEGRRKAKAAGIDRIVSNGEFHRGMSDLIGRYSRSDSSTSL